MAKKKLTTKSLIFTFEEPIQAMDFEMTIEFKTPPKKTHITILEKPKKVSDASTKLF